jgi:type IV/VI secretion system ImpK/VasF family protein
VKLLDLYEPVFQYLCRLQRASRAAAHTDYNRVRSDLRETLGQIERDAAMDVRLANQARRLDLPIVFFIDNIICTSRLPFAKTWFDNRLAVERGEQAGDERFFEFLEADLHDPSEEAAERLAVYHVCLGLGFTGIYMGQPDRIRGYVDTIFPRIRQWMDTDPRTKVSEEAYRSTDKRVLTEPPSKMILLMTILFVGFVIGSVLIYAELYRHATTQLNESVSQILGYRSDPSRP